MLFIEKYEEMFNNVFPLMYYQNTFKVLLFKNVECEAVF